MCVSFSFQVPGLALGGFKGVNPSHERNNKRLILKRGHVVFYNRLSLRYALARSNLERSWQFGLYTILPLTVLYGILLQLRVVEGKQYIAQ